MPYGPPQAAPENSVYSTLFTHNTTGLNFGLSPSDSGGSVTEQEKDAAVQLIIDLVAVSPEFTYNGGFKTYGTSIAITPNT